MTNMQNTALLIIDVQEGLDDPRLGQRNNPHAEANMRRLLSEWRQRNRPVFHIQHMSTETDSPLRPELPGNRIKAALAPQDDEALIRKQTNSAFIGTDLHDRLRRDSLRSLLIIGLTTDHCVSSTARMASDLGYHAFVAADATAAHEKISFDGQRFSADAVHELALAHLHQEFATVLTADQALAMP